MFRSPAPWCFVLQPEQTNTVSVRPPPPGNRPGPVCRAGWGTAEARRAPVSPSGRASRTTGSLRASFLPQGPPAPALLCPWLLNPWGPALYFQGVHWTDSCGLFSYRWRGNRKGQAGPSPLPRAPCVGLSCCPGAPCSPPCRRLRPSPRSAPLRPAPHQPSDGARCVVGAQ